MLPISSGHFDNNFSYRRLILMFSAILCLITILGCAKITIKPRDPELIALEAFANKVTSHIFEVNPYTYEEYQKSLEKEVTPDVLSLLKKHGITPMSQEQLSNNVKDMTIHHKRCLVRIDSTDFPSKATAQGLIPIEVKGTCVKTFNDVSKATRFEVIYLIGDRPKTKDPIVASLEIKKFD